MEPQFSEETQMLKSMGFTHVADSVITNILRKSNGDVEQALDMLLAMQFEVAEEVPATVAPAEDEGGKERPLDTRPAAAEGETHAADSMIDNDELIDTLVGLLLPPCQDAQESLQGDVRTCADLERALLQTPSAPTHSSANQSFPPQPDPRLQASAAPFHPDGLFRRPEIPVAQHDDGFQTVTGKRPAINDSGGTQNSTSRSPIVPERIRLVVLVGLPGSGKSTLASKFREGKWWIVCQDDLGNRRACEDVLYQKLSQGHRVVVDRTNMDRAQRAHWTRIARDLRVPIQAVVAIHLDVPVQTCKSRVMGRPSHKTLPATPESLGIIERFASTFEQTQALDTSSTARRGEPASPI